MNMNDLALITSCCKYSDISAAFTLTLTVRVSIDRLRSALQELWCRVTADLTVTRSLLTNYYKSC